MEEVEENRNERGRETYRSLRKIGRTKSQKIERTWFLFVSEIG